MEMCSYLHGSLHRWCTLELEERLNLKSVLKTIASQWSVQLVAQFKLLNRLTSLFCFVVDVVVVVNIKKKKKPDSLNDSDRQTLTSSQCNMSTIIIASHHPQHHHWSSLFVGLVFTEFSKAWFWLLFCYCCVLVIHKRTFHEVSVSQ